MTSPKPVRILIIDDNPADVMLAEECILDTESKSLSIPSIMRRRQSLLRWFGRTPEWGSKENQLRND